MINPISGVSGGGAGFGEKRITIRTDFRRISRSFQRLRTKMSNLREPLRQSAFDYMTKKEIHNRFKEQGIPRWKALSPVTITRRKKKGSRSLKILDDTGRLRESATGGRGFFIKYNPSSRPKSVTFGSTVPYAELHDRDRGSYTVAGEGKSKIPGRPWTEVTQKNADEMRDILMRWTQKKLKESGFRGI